MLYLSLKKQRSCVIKNELRFQKWHKESGEFLHKVMLDKSSVYNGLAEGMCYLDKSSPSNFDFWTFYWLSEVAQIPHGIFDTRSQLLYKLCTIL